MIMTDTSKLILLSAGGTGGHVFPAAALGRDLISRGYRVELVTDIRGNKFANLFEDIPVHVVSAGSLGRGLLGRVRGAGSLAYGIFQAHRLIKRLKPAVVVGFGGYPSFPAMFAAQRMNLPTIIHEQNAIVGRANAMLTTRASRIALSMPHVHGLDPSDNTRAVVTGNPVREEISLLSHKPYPIIQADGPLRIFIMGGSLGAHVFADIVPAALSRLSAEYRARIEVVQQCRETDIDNVRRIYDAAGIRCELETFFRDVPARLAHSHLVIARSGASTVAEVTTAGRPAIFVPYPHHADQQQKANADMVADAGGAWVMTQNGFTEEALLARVETFLQNPQTLFRAAEAARSVGRPDAARRLGNVVMAVASGWDGDAMRPQGPTPGTDE